MKSDRIYAFRSCAVGRHGAESARGLSILERRRLGREDRTGTGYNRIGWIYAD